MKIVKKSGFTETGDFTNQSLQHQPTWKIAFFTKFVKWRWRRKSLHSTVTSSCRSGVHIHYKFCWWVFATIPIIKQWVHVIILVGPRAVRGRWGCGVNISRRIATDIALSAMHSEIIIVSESWRDTATRSTRHTIRWGIRTVFHRRKRTTFFRTLR